MKVIDNTIKYYELLMVYNDTSKYIEYNLPKGYHFDFYKDGDQLEWVNIHIESGEFTSINEGIRNFDNFYGHFLHELNKRCIFIIDDITGEKVATATISLLDDKQYGYDAAVDWVAIKKKYQGYKLSKPLITKIITVAHELGHQKIILHTQTTTWLAAKIYLDLGFIPFNTNEVIGWRILKTLTNHEVLKNFEEVSPDIIYDKRNIEIEKQLIKIYKTDNFNYSVWYKNGLHNVYVYYDNKSFEYEYFEENGKIKLRKIL